MAFNVRFYTHLILCLSAFFFGAYFSIRLLPNRNSAIHQKVIDQCREISRLETNEGRTLIAFYGASMTLSNVNPDVFDSNLSALTGKPYVSYNFALPAARLNETLYSVRNSFRLMRRYGIELPEYIFVDLTLEPISKIVRREVARKSIRRGQREKTREGVVSYVERVFDR